MVVVIVIVIVVIIILYLLLLLLLFLRNFVECALRFDMNKTTEFAFITLSGNLFHKIGLSLVAGHFI